MKWRNENIKKDHENAEINNGEEMAKWLEISKRK
jgi:hypothetical protein